MNTGDATPSFAPLVNAATRRIGLPIVAIGAVLVALASIASGHLLEHRLLVQAHARGAALAAQLAADPLAALAGLEPGMQLALLDAAATTVIASSDPALREAGSPALAAARAGFDGRYWIEFGRLPAGVDGVARYWLRRDLAAELHDVAVQQLIVTLGGILFVTAGALLVRRRLRRELLPRLDALATALTGRAPTDLAAGDELAGPIAAAGDLHAALAEGRRREHALAEEASRLRAQAGQTHAAHETLLSALFEVAQEGLWVLDADLCTVDANARLGELLALAPTALRGRPFGQFLAADREILVAELADTLAGAAFPPREIALERDGIPVPARLSATALPGREPAALLLSLIDPSPARDAAATLAVSARRYARAAASAELTLWECDAARPLLALPFSHCHPDDEGRVLTAFAEHAAGRAPRVDVEFRQQHEDGSWRWLRAQGEIGVADDAAGGAARCVLGVLREITAERDAREALIRARDEALRATQAKSQFLADMSHELRTPLNGVLGMLSLLERERLSDEQREFVDVAVKSGRTLFELIGDVLDFSKIEAGALQLERTVCPLHALAEDAIDMLAERAHQRGIDLVLRWDPALPRRIETDPARLRQVLLNLLDNGVKFTERGHVMLSLAPAANGCIRFEVADTGIGIPRDRQQAIFDPFRQAEDSTTRRYGGTGLGLGITRQLVERMGGQVALESEPGRGSRFVFELPLAHEPAADDAPPALAGRRILLQEPVAVVADAGAALLEAHGARVERVRDRRELAAVLGMPDAAYDLALVAAGGDLQQAGQELARLRGLPQGARLPLIATLPFGRRTGIEELRILGVQALLTKPWRESHVLRIVNEVLAPDALAALAVTIPHRRPAGSEERSLRAVPKVLVVDDVVTNLKVAAGMLAKLGIEAQLAESGRAALDAVAVTEFDVVLMDCQMPGMDGFETTALIRARYLPDEGPRIIAMTANAASTDRDRCLAHGMHDYLAKPVLLSDLERVLQRWTCALNAVPMRGACRVPAPSIDGAIDRRKFEELAGLLGPEGFEALCARFRIDGRQQIDAFGVALSGADLAAARRATHALKGAAANVGAAHLAALCRDADKAGGDELRRVQAALEAAFEEFCGVLEQHAVVTA